MIVLFCFFKQKTAYEMRISDWSSDVCSSDLKLIREVEQTLATALREEGIGASVVGRAKNIYGVYQKMRRKKLKLLKVTDLLGFCVIVNKVDEDRKSVV